MKIIMNVNYYGSYRLSCKAVMRYAELKGITIYAYIHPTKRCGGYDNNFLVPYSNEADEFVKNGAVYSTKQFKRISWDSFHGKHKDFVFYSFDIKRTDKILVKVVEELGKDANGEFACLTVTEIPADVKYEILSDGGTETIHEKHRSWS